MYPSITGFLTMSIILRLVCPQTEIVESPRSVLGYDGRQVSFKCTVRAPYRVLWNLNGEAPPSDPELPPYRAFVYIASWSTFNRTSIMTIDASAQTNNTAVSCTAVSFETFEHYSSPNVHLTVQGVPGAPLVMYSNDSHSVNLTLAKPYCLPNADITHYGLLAEASYQNIVVAANFTESTFKFILSKYNISRCEDQYINFSLCAFNLAGEGDFRHLSVFLPGNDDGYCSSPDKITTVIQPYLIAVSALGLIVVVSILIILCAFLLTSLAINIGTKKFPDKQVVTTDNIAYDNPNPELVKNEAYEISCVRRSDLDKHKYEMIIDPVYEKVGERKTEQGGSFAKYQSEDA